MFRSRPHVAAMAPLLFSIMLASPGMSGAQTTSLQFTNTDLEPIKLLNGTTVGIDGNGNLSAQCVLDGTVCEGLSNAVAGPVPAVSLTRTGTGNINTGSTLTLNWTVQPAADICVASSSPAVPGWNNTVVSAAGGSANLSMSTNGTFALSLKCYNEFGVSNLANVSVTVVGLPDVNQIPACTDQALVSTGRVQPTGFTGHLVQWSQFFYGQQFPHGPSHLSPNGAFTLKSLAPSTNGPMMNARYLTIPFQPSANSSYSVSWLGVQPVFVQNVVSYLSPRVAQNVFVSISPCAGDLRAPSQFGDASLKLCRAQLNSGSLKFGTTGAVGQCALSPGQQYFLNVAFVDTTVSGALSTTTTTCVASAGNRCEANFNGN
ncbi:hypothetical protein [Chiayiivirga flava]|uniref:Ig-like domain-containing protein n=1 Tax=Chiayiivirga flava TaxID=659595 RepID=A0A7W8G1B7_9GAMM|nr:hypothetical protein [Chiayiivirga flava]MBB5208703.1 hypothetical protein [Chiayiivirga flava]